MKNLIAASAALSLIAAPGVAAAKTPLANTVAATAAAPLSLANAAPVRAAAKGSKANVSNAGIAAFAVIVIGGAVAALAVIGGTRDDDGPGIPTSR